MKIGDWVQHREFPEEGIARVMSTSNGWVHVEWKEGEGFVSYEEWEVAKVQPPKLITRDKTEW